MMEQKPPLLQDVVNNMRDNILRTQSQSSTAAITSYDALVEQMGVFVKKSNDQGVEIIRLQELCKKNNINYAIPPVSQIVSPAPSTQQITNPPAETPKPEDLGN